MRISDWSSDVCSSDLVSAQICTFLACLAIAFATASSVTALDRSGVPAALRGATLALGVGVGLAGIPLALMRSGPIDLWAAVLSFAILADLAAVALCLAWGWRRGADRKSTRLNSSH